MSALARLQRAIEDIKKTYSDYVAGKITNLKLAELVESNVRLARNLMEEIYPKDTVKEFDERTKNDLGDDIFAVIWENKRERPRYGVPAAKSYIECALTELTAFFEALFVRKIPVENELQQLEYDMDRLAEQLSLGQISEETYKTATKRLQEKANRLKSLNKD
jgi:hypothetical protein